MALLLALSVAHAAGAACTPAPETTPDLEWSGPSLRHGYQGDPKACAAWCCELEGCEAWSLLYDSNCHLEPGQQCCMVSPAADLTPDDAP